MINDSPFVIALSQKTSKSSEESQNSGSTNAAGAKVLTMVRDENHQGYLLAYRDFVYTDSS